MESHNGEAEDLPPPPPLNAGDEPLKAEETKKPVKPTRALVPRKGFGKKGQPIRLVNLKYEDDTPVDRKGAGRSVIEKLQQTYAAELANKDFAYDGEKSLFTIGALPQNSCKWQPWQ
nr:unnamed protein product [Digitaria exilis]